MSDGPLGVRSNQKFPSTTYAAGIGLAASWIRNWRSASVQASARTPARAAFTSCSTGVNLYRAPMNGRNFEYFGEDPSSQAPRRRLHHRHAEAGRQLYRQAFPRQQLRVPPARYAIPSSTSAPAREIISCLRIRRKDGHVGAIMNSFNLLNGQHTTQNGFFNTDVVKKQWGFQGIVMSAGLRLTTRWGRQRRPRSRDAEQATT